MKFQLPRPLIMFAYRIDGTNFVGGRGREIIEFTDGSHQRQDDIGQPRGKRTAKGDRQIELGKVTGPVHEVDNTYETHRNVLSEKKNTRTVGTPGELSVIGYTVNEIGQRVQRNLSGEIRAEFYGGQVADIYPTDWGYDALGQVTSEDKPSTTADRGYSYDQIGNRRTSTADSATTTYTANSLNQYSQISVPSVQSVVPIHDQDGNMTTGLLNGSATGEFEYDGANQLIRTQTTATSDPTRYAYDAFGRRIAKVTYPNAGGTPTAATVFIYDGWNLIAEYKLDAGAWSLDRTFTWGKDLSGSTQGAGGVGGLLAVTKHEAQSATFYPCFDGNGNIEAYLDSTGAPAAIYQYDAFGNVLSGGGKGATMEQANFSHRFSTKCQDAETGLLHYGYRYLDTNTGRWANRDPIEESGGANLNAFVVNSSINGIDVDGRIIWWVPPVVVGVGVPLADKAGTALGGVGVPEGGLDVTHGGSPDRDADGIMHLAVNDCEILIFIGHGNFAVEGKPTIQWPKPPDGFRYRAGAITCFPSRMNAAVPLQNRAYMIPEHNVLMSHEGDDWENDINSALRANKVKEDETLNSDNSGNGKKHPSFLPTLPKKDRGWKWRTENWNPQAVRNALSRQAILQSRRELCGQGCACVTLKVIVEDAPEYDGIENLPDLFFDLKLKRGKTSEWKLPACPSPQE